MDGDAGAGDERCFSGDAKVLGLLFLCGVEFREVGLGPRACQAKAAPQNQTHSRKCRASPWGQAPSLTDQAHTRWGRHG